MKNYVKQPQDFYVRGHDDKVYLLKKTLYCLKQAPRAWNNWIEYHLYGLDFDKSLRELTLFDKKRDSSIVVISLYVDDIPVTRNNLEMIHEFKVEMNKVFEMKDIEEMSYCLGM